MNNNIMMLLNISYYKCLPAFFVIVGIRLLWKLRLIKLIEYPFCMCTTYILKI